MWWQHTWLSVSSLQITGYYTRLNKCWCYSTWQLPLHYWMKHGIQVSSTTLSLNMVQYVQQRQNPKAKQLRFFTRNKNQIYPFYMVLTWPCHSSRAPKPHSSVIAKQTWQLIFLSYKQKQAKRIIKLSAVQKMRQRMKHDSSEVANHKKVLRTQLNKINSQLVRYHSSAFNTSQQLFGVLV